MPFELLEYSQYSEGKANTFVESRNVYGATPLNEAAWNDGLEFVGYSVEQAGENIASISCHRQTPPRQRAN